MNRSSVLLVILVLSGCSGFRFGPGYSMNDAFYFSEPPHIVTKADHYKLCWRYGEWGCAFQPKSEVVNGELLFALQTTTGSDNLNGQYADMRIMDPKRVHALETGGAFWLEPDGRKIRLIVSR